MKNVLLLLAVFVGLTFGHGGTSEYLVDGVSYPGWSPDLSLAVQENDTSIVQRKWITIDPIFQPDNISVTCNFPGIAAPSSIHIQAGSNISAVYHYWLHNTGPMILWMADCGSSCYTANITDLDWFKIEEIGLLSGTIEEGWWGQRAIQNWDGSPDLWTSTIPKDLKPGNYLLRHEIIAIHIPNKPQWYPECVQLVLEGKGKSVPGEEYMAKIPGVWTADMPALNIDIYSDAVRNLTTYVIPGPPVWPGGEVTQKTWLQRIIDGFKGP